LPTPEKSARDALFTWMIRMRHFYAIFTILREI
jgi:hypothetical protein